MCRTEGYCYLPVPATAGTVCRRLSAWRPVGSRQAQLRRFFIGGSPELEDPSFVAVPTEFQVRSARRVARLRHVHEDEANGVVQETSWLSICVQWRRAEDMLRPDYWNQNNGTFA